MSGTSGQSSAQRAVHVATRKPGKRRTAAATAAGSDGADVGTGEDVQRRLTIMMTMMLLAITTMMM